MHYRESADKDIVRYIIVFSLSEPPEGIPLNIQGSYTFEKFLSAMSIV